MSQIAVCTARLAHLIRGFANLALESERLLSRFPGSSCVLLALFATTACSKWPPQRDALVTFVNEHKSQIEVLVAEFQDSDFGRINCSRCTWTSAESDDATDSEKFMDGLWRRVENPRGPRFAKLLKAAGVWGVSKRFGGEIELIIPLSSGVDDSRYVIQLFHDPAHRNDCLKEFVNEFQKIDCGWCKVTVDEKLWIRYGWWPDDPIPEATRARDEGEMSWDEWVRSSHEALEDCQTQGLLEQGYRPPDSE